MTSKLVLFVYVIFRYNAALTGCCIAISSACIKTVPDETGFAQELSH
jgi:hypothetical protein